MMGRRTMMAGAAAAFTAGEAAAATDSQDDPRVAAAEAVFLYALPLYEMGRVRDRALGAGQQPNRFYHAKALADARSRLVTTPNVDTLYAVAWIDLSAGPVEIGLPEPADRYVSLALLDEFSNNIAVLHPGEAARVSLAFAGGAPGSRDERTALVSPTVKVWALARTYVAGSADLESAHLVQQGFRLSGPAVAPEARPVAEPAVRAEPAALFDALAGLIRANPRPGEDRPLLAQLEVLGLVPDSTQAPAAILAAGRAAALARMRTAPRSLEGGWFYPKDDLGEFGEDYLFRAQVAVGGLAALPVREALYLTAFSGQSGRFQGDRSWRLRFAPGALPPVGAFWSLTLYEPDGAGGLYFFDNPEHIYAVKDRDPSFRRRTDGGVEIVVARDRPADQEVNWLPAPAGPFSLIFRAYRPGAGLLDRSYRLPPVEAE